MTDEPKEQSSTELAGAWQDALAEQTGAGKGGQGATMGNYEKAQFGELHSDVQGGKADVNLEVILDIPVTLSVEIGRTRQTIRNLLQLNQGSVVELDRLAGEPMDVLVNGTLIAHGEVVVVNDKFGIRLTDVISAAERVKKLR